MSKSNGIKSHENVIGKGKAGPGRPKGHTNKVTKALKDMILGALSDAGGQEYLTRQADENPAAFMTLVGKVLPTTLTGDPNNPVVIQKIERAIIDNAQD